MKKLVVVYVLCLLLAGLIFYKLQSRILISKPDLPKVGPSTTPNPVLSGWLPSWEEQRFVSDLADTNLKLETILPGWYQISPEGKVYEVQSPLKDKVLSEAKLRNFQVIPSVSNANNEGFDPERISLLLGDEALLSEQTDELLRIAQENGYKGWDIDWEEIREDDKERFSNFIETFAGKLHGKGMILSVSVHAKSGQNTDWQGTKGQDWKALGKYADEIRIMAYDFHNSHSSPGPITPAEELKRTLEYAVKVIPIEKIVLGIPTYGYDWSEGQGKGLNFVDIQKLLSKNKIESSRDSNSNSLTAYYNLNGTDHVVWFEDSESYKFKKSIALGYGVYKFSFWHLGGEDPNIWQ